MKIKFEIPEGYAFFTEDSEQVPVPRVGEFVIVRRVHKGFVQHSWVELKVTKIVHDYDEREIYIELKEVI